jgi:hypothetical protein
LCCLLLSLLLGLNRGDVLCLLDVHMLLVNLMLVWVASRLAHLTYLLLLLKSNLLCDQGGLASC